MCDCLTWHHPIWALVGKRAAVATGIVWSVFCVLRENDPVLGRLLMPDRICTLAIGLGFKPAQVALVIAGLQHSGVINDELRLIGEWAVTLGDAVTHVRDAVTLGDASVTLGDARVMLGDADPLARRRALGRERTRRWRAKTNGYAASSADNPQSYPVTRGDAPQEEKEEDHLLLSQKEAQARETQPTEYIRKERWATGIMRRSTAAGLLSQDVAARLWSDLMLMRPDRSLKNWGLPRRANDELDRLERLLEDREAPKLPLGSAQLLPVEGGRGPPVRPEAPAEVREAARRLAFAKVNQRMTG